MNESDPQCAGQPALCPNCTVDLIHDPQGPWCRTCRRAWQGETRYPPCPHPAIATGNTPRTRRLRLCREHARRLVDRGGPDAVTLDQPAAQAPSRAHADQPRDKPMPANTGLHPPGVLDPSAPPVRYPPPARGFRDGRHTAG